MLERKSIKRSEIESPKKKYLVKCIKCGYEYENYVVRGDIKKKRLTCPNCGYKPKCCNELKMIEKKNGN